MNFLSILITLISISMVLNPMEGNPIVSAEESSSNSYNLPGLFISKVHNQTDQCWMHMTSQGREITINPGQTKKVIIPFILKKHVNSYYPHIDFGYYCSEPIIFSKVTNPSHEVRIWLPKIAPDQGIVPDQIALENIDRFSNLFIIHSINKEMSLINEYLEFLPFLQPHNTVSICSYTLLLEKNNQSINTPEIRVEILQNCQQICNAQMLNETLKPFSCQPCKTDN